MHRTAFAPSETLPSLHSIAGGKLLDSGNTYLLPCNPTADQIIALACNILANRHRVGDAFTDPDATKRMLRLRIGDSPREIFHVLFLDTRNRMIHEESLFFGTIDGAVIEPREVVRAALLCNAAGVILSHCHPSSNTEPSRADIEITRHLKEALSLVRVRLLDHIVVGRTDATSFAERGLL